MKKQRVKLTKGHCEKLPHLDKKYFEYDLDCPGLWFKVMPSGYKSWEYSTRIKGKSPTRFPIGPFNNVTPPQARLRVRKIQKDIFDGKDPAQIKRQWAEEKTLSEGLKDWFKNTLTAPRFERSTIKHIKSALTVWVFHKTNDIEVKKKITLLEDLRHKRISLITKKHIKKLHEVISEKSPYMANRVVAYLKMFFNHEIDDDQTNPCKIPSKELNQETEYLDYLTNTELEAVLNKAFVKDERSGRLLNSYYKKRNLAPVSCCAIAFQYSSGRRTRSEGSNIQWSWLRYGEEPQLVLPKTKTSKKQKRPKLNFGLSAFSMDIISTIKKEKLFEDSAFYYPPGDERNKYVFPSKDFGRINAHGKPSKTPHVNDLRVTFKKLLAMVGITRHLKHYATRHSNATAVLRKKGNIKLVAEILGTTDQTASKYAKTQHREEIEVLDQVFSNRVKEKIREVK